MEKRFEGKVALVTGANTGMGQATAVRLASEGALVAVNHRESGDPAETLAKIKEAGGEGFPVLADMRQPPQIVAMIQEVAEKGGRLDYLVSNAAINPFMPWDQTTVEDFDALSETNLRGTCQPGSNGPWLPLRTIRNSSGSVLLLRSRAMPELRAIPTAAR